MVLRFAKTLQIGIAGLILCGSAGAQENPKPAVAAAERVFAQKVALQGVPNFGQVTASLFRGAQPSDDGFGALAKMGVGIVVDLRGDSDNERERVTKLGMEYVAVPYATPAPDWPSGIAEFTYDPSARPLRIKRYSCIAGGVCDRTGMMVAAYRISQGWTAEEGRGATRWNLCSDFSTAEHQHGLPPDWARSNRVSPALSQTVQHSRIFVRLLPGSAAAESGERFAFRKLSSQLRS